MNPVNTKTARNQGFTLIEVMVVLVLLGLGVLGALGTISKTMTASKGAIQRTTAAQAMRAKVEELKHQPFDQLFTALSVASTTSAVTTQTTDPVTGEVTTTETTNDPTTGEVTTTETTTDPVTGKVTTTESVTKTDTAELTRTTAADGTEILVKRELTPQFSVQGLTLREGGTAHGTITILGEADVLAFWGVTADFDDDGTKASPPPATAEEAKLWKALPIRVEVQWGAGRDAESLELNTIILNPGF